ncbi:uncharacterized protein LOC130933813 [Arachis stenosperma]|uniref:uncharacterized protein LOC130933813 n=1 Tax=Arachis stenosperma TaxID=217475 RepID=UPI0025AC2D14|nr:uncharacterized protein LOC130933813 [Arachis stenosperma]
MPRKPQYTVSNAAGIVAGHNSQTHANPQTDGTHDTGADTSIAQRRARAPPPPHSGHGARQSRVNIVPFRPPRNETRLDSSENGVISSMELTVKEALALPPRKKVVLHHNRELQQVDQAAGLLSGFLETLGSDFQQLPICAKSWKTMSKASKEHAYDQVKRVFHYEDDKRWWIKRGIVQRIGSCWRNSRNNLFHKVYNEELTFEENIRRKPARIEEKCRINDVNRSKQQYTHTGGSKTMARKRHEEEAIELIESQDPSSKEFSQNDFLVQVLGKEHPGRVRGLGISTCSSRCFRNIPEQSDYSVQIEEYQMEIVKLKAEAAELKTAAAEEKAKRQRMETEAAEGKAKI